MSSKEVARQIAMKLRFENKFKPKLRRFFKQIATDTKHVWSATGRIPSLDSFNVELQAILRAHYRDVAKEFKKTPLNNFKSFTTESNKQFVEQIPGGSDSSDNFNTEALLAAGVFTLQNAISKAEKDIASFIVDQSVKQSEIILRTTEKELQAVSADVIVSNSMNENQLDQEGVGKQIEQQFNEASSSRIETIAVTETQSSSETSKLLMVAALLLITDPAGLPIGTMVKTWNTVIDDVTRPSHAAANGQTVPTTLPFVVEGERLIVPGNSSLGASAKNIINCRCVATYDFVGSPTTPAITML